MNYQWEKYTDGEWWQLMQGEDYQAQTVSVRASVSSWAKRNGYEAATALTKDGDGFLLRMKPL